MTDTNANLSARDLHAEYVRQGGTKAFTSFKNKAAILDAIVALVEANNADAEPTDTEYTAAHDFPAEEAAAAMNACADANDAAEEEIEASDDADAGEDDTGSDEALGRITEKLSKVQRAKLRKLLGGKLTEGRWNTARIPVSILEKIGCRYEVGGLAGKAKV